MASEYFIDLAQISLEDYKKMLKNVQLLPGRRILYEQIDEHLESLAQKGIANLLQLLEALKSSKRIEQLSKELNIPAEYLTILRREANTLSPKKVLLSDFPGIEPPLIIKLHEKGIYQTLQLFEACATSKMRKDFAVNANIHPVDLESITKLADLSRIWGVGPVFCRIFYESGIDSVEKVANSNATELYKKLEECNVANNYTKAKFTVKDIENCISIAKNLPKTIEL